MGVVLIGGLKHSGKTSQGRIVAQSLEYRFFDLDELILDEAGGKWKSVRTIWESMGQAELMRLEMEAARNFVEWHVPSLGGQGAVLSMGGGTVENSDAMVWLRHRGLNVYLRGDAELLYRRIMRHGRPPFLSPEKPWEDFQRLWAKRNALYTDFAQVILDVDDAPVTINAQRLVVAIGKHYAR